MFPHSSQHLLERFTGKPLYKNIGTVMRVGLKKSSTQLPPYSMGLQPSTKFFSNSEASFSRFSLCTGKQPFRNSLIFCSTSDAPPEIVSDVNQRRNGRAQVHCETLQRTDHPATMTSH